MKSQSNTRTCLFCNEVLRSGRRDRKYCNPQCKAQYHNTKRLEKDNFKHNIQQILKKNWQILNRMNPEGHTTVRKASLSDAGYNFNYFTNIYKTKEGRVYFFCYDLGFVQHQHPEKVTIVKWQSYMKQYSLPV